MGLFDLGEADADDHPEDIDELEEDFHHAMDFEELDDDLF